jgi:hypothetical protein
MIPQSHAINRYVARRFGFMGKDDGEAAIIDAAYEQVNDGTCVQW